LANLGTLELDSFNECNAVSSRCYQIQHHKGRVVPFDVATLIVGIGAKEEMESVVVEVFAEVAALEVWKYVAELCHILLLGGRAGEILDEHGASKAVFAGA